MVEQLPKRAETADAARVDYLLGVLRMLSPQDPPAAQRDRLELLSSERLRGRPRPDLQWWLRPAAVVTLLIAIVTIAVLVAYVRQSELLRVGIESRVVSPKEPFSAGSGALSAVPATEVRSPKTSHALPRLAQNTAARRMVVRLPYSNNAIDTGTDATIRVSMSQAELVSLGFPMNATLHDRRVIAELTLGDDGLPRAISVPLPLEVLREKR